MKTLICAYCKEEFEPPDDESWNDDKAALEAAKLWPGVSMSEMEVVCDDCFKKMGLSDEDIPENVLYQTMKKDLTGT